MGGDVSGGANGVGSLLEDMSDLLSYNMQLLVYICVKFNAGPIKDWL
jgi:hypothetical protein